MTAEETKRIERLTEGFHQITEEFKTWVNGEFKQLSTKIGALVVDTDVLVKQSERCVKLSDDLVVLSARAAERTKELSLRVRELEKE